MKRTLLLLALLAAGPGPLAYAQDLAAHALPPGISWQQGDVDAAFARARAENKPVFLYWGAVWCPPCNQVKATIFNRQDFIAAARQFIPVYLDGDSDNAQQLGSRFKVRGYPTMILFKPDGTEITRLPGEVDPERYLGTLRLGLTAARPVKALLAEALAGDKLAAADWQLLADYAWDVDQGQIVAEGDLPATLQGLADRAPKDQPAVAHRLRLKALVAAAGEKTPPAVDKDAARSLVLTVLDKPAEARANADVLLNSPAGVVKLLTDGDPQRAHLAQRWGAALLRLQNDAGLSRADRLGALSARIELARLQHPKGALSPVLVADARREVQAADQATANPYERQAVITSAADILSELGLLDESDALLKAELDRSHAPYYHMLILASNAKQRGDKAAALDWYQQAYQASQGPATRLQWGASYVGNAVDLAAQDAQRIEQAASAVFKDAAADSGAFYERSRRSLERVVAKLKSWNKEQANAAAVARLATQLDGVCGKLPSADPQKPVCDGLVRSLKS